jgi:hypothetical protein
MADSAFPQTHGTALGGNHVAGGFETGLPSFNSLAHGRFNVVAGIMGRL